MSDADQVIIASPGGYEGRKENVMKNRLYKAYDFASGHTYLIGEHKSKADAMAYCKTCGMQVISQTVVALSEEEYKTALEHRIEE